MEQPLVTFPSVVSIIGCWDAGKTYLARYLMLQNVHLIACVIVFSNTADENYLKNYYCVNRRYCYTEFNEKNFKNALTIARRIKDNSDGKMYTVIWFDDFVGMVITFLIYV